uniref:Wsv423-like protein n=1 Tax=Metapenaeus ensis nimavirus TaxID=2133794 RepID=A0A401IPF5_9VIRU|nr:MAG: wsv423-like protein [Metapenaeus ensis nimavirus]GBG35481.1 wsv423-like protein [Metapenaeus ensis nimavirus]
MWPIYSERTRMGNERLLRNGRRHFKVPQDVRFPERHRRQRRKPEENRGARPCPVQTAHKGADRSKSISLEPVADQNILRNRLAGIKSGYTNMGQLLSTANQNPTEKSSQAMKRYLESDSDANDTHTQVITGKRHKATYQPTHLPTRPPIRGGPSTPRKYASFNNQQRSSNDEKLRIAKEMVRRKGGISYCNKRTTPVVFSESQQPTKDCDYIDNLFCLPPERRSSRTSTVSSTAGSTPPDNANALNSVVSTQYTPMSLLLGQAHEKSSSFPETETLVVNKSGLEIKKWGEMKKPPVYFQGAEANTDIRDFKKSDSKFRRTVADLVLSKPIQDIIHEFDNIKSESNNCTKTMRTISRSSTPPPNWWPVGMDGSMNKPSTCMDPSLLHKYSLSTTILSIGHLMQDLGLSHEAQQSVLAKKTTLLYEVSKMCKAMEEKRKNLRLPNYVPRECAPHTIIIDSNERILEVKTGVYYILDKGTVIKFLTKPHDLIHIVMEIAVGNGARNIKGVVGVTRTCPDAFCVEMDFAGMALRDVLLGDAKVHMSAKCRNCQQQSNRHYIPSSPMKSVLYGVVMLQKTNRLPPSLREVSNVPITNSYRASGVTKLMRQRLMGELPFVISEMVNIATRLSQQGLINPDIKSDNIVIDGRTGQPKMIDFGLAIPTGSSDPDRVSLKLTEKVYAEFPQTAPEYLRGENCDETTMSYGLAFLIFETLSAITSRTTDIAAACMSINIPLQAFINKAHSHDPNKRPRAYQIIPFIGACFPFKNDIAKLFKDPKHIIYESLPEWT